MAILVTRRVISAAMVLELLDAEEIVVVLDDLSKGFAWAVPANVTLIRGMRAIPPRCCGDRVALWPRKSLPLSPPLCQGGPAGLLIAASRKR
jgi:hypothetical protein